MKRILVISVALIVVAAAVFLTGRHVSIRRLDSRNVRHDADWFVSSLVVGNERNTEMHLSITDMNQNDLAQRIVEYSDELKDTDFASADLKFSKDGDRKIATFLCEGGIQFTWTTDNGEVWRIHSLAR